MADKAWKKFERTIARFFGCERTGPMQAKDANDINHEILHVQCKHSQRHAIVSVWDAAKVVADKAGKIPCVALKQKGRHGWWIMCKADDLTAVANQREIAQRQK
jgi:thymidylate synthase